jgi:uncharacterized membrane protein
MADEGRTMSSGIFGLTLVAALGCGLAAGVFFAFSAFVMAGLDRLPAAQGITAMQSINVTAVRPVFMIALFGTALASAALAVWALFHLGERRAMLVLGGSALYLVGSIGLTMVHHVPMNDALATLDPGGGGAAGHWSHYVDSWTAWNHVRGAAALGAAAAFTAALAA